MTSTIIINTNHFMDAYHAPYKPRHRYWAGVLLLVRATLYLVSALNVFGNPRVNLMAIILVMALFYLLQSFIMSNVYKQSSLNFLETTFFPPGHNNILHLRFGQQRTIHQEIHIAVSSSIHLNQYCTRYLHWHHCISYLYVCMQEMSCQFEGND